MSVSISNTSGRCLVFVLPHDPVCASLGRCQCEPAARRQERPVAPSLTLATGMARSGVPDAFLEAPDLARAVRRGEVRVVREVETPTESPDPLEPPEAAEKPRVDEGARPSISRKRGSE